LIFPVTPVLVYCRCFISVAGDYGHHQNI
jgi:hypothetical protein